MKAKRMTYIPPAPIINTPAHTHRCPPVMAYSKDIYKKPSRWVNLIGDVKYWVIKAIKTYLLFFAIIWAVTLCVELINYMNLEVTLTEQQYTAIFNASLVFPLLVVVIYTGIIGIVSIVWD